DLWRARQEHCRAPCLPQHRADDRTPLRRAVSRPEGREGILTCPTEWGGFTHRYFQAPRSAEELVAGCDAIAAWARITYGWLGRSPDYKAAFLATLGANAEFYPPYQHNARRRYRYSQERVPSPNHPS